MIHSQLMTAALLLPFLASIVTLSRLRIDHPHACKRRSVPQIRLGTIMPLINFLNNLEPTTVVDSTRELDKPWTHVVGSTFGHPDSDFSFILYGVFPPVTFLQSDTEYPTERFHSHRRPKFFRPLAV